MADPKLIVREDLVVALDYGQFYLHTNENDPDIVETLVEQALAAGGIAQAAGVLVVMSPHQNNFAMGLAVEVWDAEPTDDLDEWQEAFEATLEVTNQLVYESPTVELTEIDLPPGSYAALITGRGFVSHGWPGSTEPGDSWRIRLWPSRAPEPPRRLRAFGEPAVEVADAAGVDERRERALDAARRIKADLDRAPSARVLTGDLGEAVIDAVVAGKVARYWFLAANLDVTAMCGRGEPAIGGTFEMQSLSSFGDPHDDDPITGSNGVIHCQWTELTRPNRVAMTWQWFGPEGWVFLPGDELYRRLGSGEAVPRRVPRLEKSTTLSVEVEDATTEDGTVMTRLVLAHRDVPVEWINDLRDFWKSKIDVWGYQVGLPDKHWRGR